MRHGAAVLTAICFAGCASAGKVDGAGDSSAVSAASGAAESVVVSTSSTPSAPASVLDAYKPPAPGTMLRLKSVYHDEHDSELRQIVVLTGEDYAVYANLTDGAFGGPSDLFVEYSGLFWQDCSQPALSGYQRRKLQGMWPVKVGNTATLPFQGNVAEPMTVKVIDISKQSHATLGSLDVVRVVNSYESSDYSDFAPSLGVSIRIDWGEPGTDANIGHDELVTVDKVDLSQVASLVDMAKQHCMPAS